MQLRAVREIASVLVLVYEFVGGNPRHHGAQTLADFREVLNAKIREGMTRKEAFLTLTPEQRIQYDTLEAESTREAREARKRAQKTEVRSAGQTTAGEIVATKHTRDGYDLFVVKLADRLSWERHRTPYNNLKDDGLRAAIDEEVKAQKGGLPGCCMVSDAFFPFRDGLDVGLREGITAVIQPGGSERDFESIEACNEAGAAMVFTGQRCFRH